VELGFGLVWTGWIIQLHPEFRFVCLVRWTEDVEGLAGSCLSRIPGAFPVLDSVLTGWADGVAGGVR
jgi:hypothetical protein